MSPPQWKVDFREKASSVGSGSKEPSLPSSAGGMVASEASVDREHHHHHHHHHSEGQHRHHHHHHSEGQQHHRHGDHHNQGDIQQGNSIPEESQMSSRHHHQHHHGQSRHGHRDQVKTASSTKSLQPVAAPEDPDMMLVDPSFQSSLNELEMRLQAQLQRLLSASITQEFAGIRGTLQQSGKFAPRMASDEERFQLATGIIGTEASPRPVMSPSFKTTSIMRTVSPQSPGKMKHAISDLSEPSVGALVEAQMKEEEKQKERRGIAQTLHEAYEELKRHVKDEDTGLGNTMRAKKGDKLQAIVESRTFQVTVFLVIVAQSTLLGVEAQTRMTLETERLDEYTAEDGLDNIQFPNWIIYGTIMFHIFFCIEIGLRIAAWKKDFLNTKDKEFFVWNLFDVSVLLGLSLEYVDVKTDLLRAFRLLRVARVLRIFRMFEKLRKMIYALMHSAQALFWLIFMLGATLYVFALAFMQGAYRYLHDMEPSHYQLHKQTDWESDPQTWMIVHRFTSLGLTMRTLFATLTGGEGWDSVLEPVIEHSWWYSVVAIFFVFFFVFAVLNIVTGVFVEEAMNIAAIDKDIASGEQMEQEKLFLRDLHQFVESVDSDQDGVLTYDELTHALSNASVQRFLVGLDIDLNQDNLAQVIAICDEGNTGEIDHVLFFDILTKMKGTARSCDLFLLHHDIRREQMKLRRILDVLMDMSQSMHTTTPLWMPTAQF